MEKLKKYSNQLPSKLKTNPIVANSSIFFLGSKNKLNVID